jgi:hypothetical protein
MRRMATVAPVVGALALAATLVPAGAGQQHLRFTKALTVIDADHLGKANTGEPRLQVLPAGRILLGAHFEQWDCDTGERTADTYAMCVWASDDGGRHWHLSGGDPQPGDDVDFAVAPDGSVLELGMTNFSAGSVTVGTGFGGTTVMRSTDGARTWTQTVDANLQLINDRPWFAATAKAVLISYTGTIGNIQAIRSTDGGESWSTPIQVSPPANPDTIDVNGGPTYDADRHELLLPYLTSTDLTCASGPAGCFNVLSLATSTDDGLTWSNEKIGELPAGSGATGPPQIDLDARGHRFLFFPGKLDGHDHVFVMDADRGGRWSAPRLVDAPQSSGIVSWGIASGRGQLDVAYYRTASADGATVSRRWDVVLGHSTDGGKHWTTSLVHSNAYTGTGDGHQLIVWDLLGISRDRRGRVLVAWTDDQGHAGGPTVVKFARTVGPVGS